MVEEIAIASGVPVPELYVLEDEPAINAFAAGWSPADAAVAVTRGALDRLNRDELQGVIAHEFSHIVSGDMRLNIRLMGLLFGILVLSIVRAGAGRIRGQRNPFPLVGLALIVVGAAGLYGPADQGGDLSATGVPGRRLGGAVHPPDRGVGRGR